MMHRLFVRFIVLLSS